MNAPVLGISHIEAAAERIRGHAQWTPLLEFADLNERLDARILLKAENLQRSGSFKFRGAYNCLASADPDARARGVVAWSSGNHAQGVAVAAKLFGVPATIVMPADAPAAKISGTRAYGAHIVFYDRYTEDREAIARALADKQGALLVPSYDHYDVIAGQGTVGLEIARQCAELDVSPSKLLVCCGGGGLSAGVAVATKHRYPQLEVFTVEPENFDDTRRSLDANERVANAPGQRSVCDALLTDIPGVLPFPILSELVAGGLVVSDHEAIAAVRYASMTLKLTVEPGGAVALAALLSGKIDVTGQAVVAVLSGGNIDPTMLAEILSSDLSSEFPLPSGGRARGRG